MRRRPPGSPLFPYTTLFRSGGARVEDGRGLGVDPQGDATACGVQPGVDGAPVAAAVGALEDAAAGADRKSTRLNSSHVAISYAVFCLKKKTTKTLHTSGLYI